MSLSVPQPPPASTLRLLGLIRWLLPLGLAITGAIIEWTEHFVIEGEGVTMALLLEVALFAIIGPVAVAITLTWFITVLEGYRSTAAAVEAMNRSLEERVAERTRDIEAVSAELAAANENLLQLDRLKSEFVSLVSHQLRAPLTNINGALEIVAQDADRLPDSSRRILQILTLETERLSRLIQTILDVQRIEAGQLVPRLGPVAIGPLLDRACAATREAELGRPLSLRVPAGLPPAWADEILVDEIVRSLLDNAVRYSKAGLPVSVDARAVKGRIEIAVVDRGTGVPPDQHDQIFRAFHRLGDTETTTRGYGLGLYFADKLVTAQGGSIDVTSPVWPEGPEPGARFSFTLPIAAEEPDDLPGEPAVEPLAEPPGESLASS